MQNYSDYSSVPNEPVQIPFSPPCMLQSSYMRPPAVPGVLRQDPYSYPYNLPAALQLIRDAVSGEREDELFYDYLINEAPSEEDKNIIRSIRDDEKKHFRMFRMIYSELTGQKAPPPKQAEFQKPESYCAGIQKALFGELGAVERYRRILFAMQDRRHINMLTEIITDEIKHSGKYNFLFSKNGCS